ncbi:MAG: hypothetical protein K6F61_03345 [Clostridiales bacterium]|nr:hypothetical protein [Clostridiales bacterium]
MKKLLSILLVLAMVISVCSLASAETLEEIIAQAQTMTNEELYKKAIEESNGKTLLGIGNSSRGKTAKETFIELLKSIDPSYDTTIEWTQPKNNSIFEALTGSSEYFVTLIQDGNQIQSKMINTGELLNFVPLDWANAEGVAKENNENPLALQTLNKVFEYNNQGDKTYMNCWDFVAEDVHPLFMGVNSEPVGKNFLYMLTRDDYATVVKEAYDKLDADKQAVFAPTIEEMEAEAADLGLEGENAKYALAWIKLWCTQYQEETDDGPICTQLVDKSAAGQAGLLVYSKLRSVEESESVSVNNVTVAAYQDGYEGFGGYAYKHYMMIPKATQYPWTACAFIAYITTTQEGFKAWGKDMGGYAPVPACMQDHSNDGGDEFPAKNDRGYDWWINTGKLVVEDPAYCASVADVMGDWIDLQIGMK